MTNFFIIIQLSFFLKQAISFEFEAVHCTASNGKPGFCRPKEHCYPGSMIDFEYQCSIKDNVCCINSGKSHEMCLKYAEEVYRPIDSGIVLPFRDDKSVQTSWCGISATPLIIGGEKAKPMEFPHMALIGFGQSRPSAEWLCGGSLISVNYILTAAHCLSSIRGPAKWVRLGILNVDSTIFEESQEIEVEKLISHPNYHHRVNDIALLKLKSNATFTPFIRPACLDDLGVLLARTGIATGWGKTTYDSAQQSNYLMKVQLDIIDRSTCSKSFKRSRFMPLGIEDTMMCAGVLTGGKDTCQGDSGGPLQVVLKCPYCMYSILSVTSYGKYCGFPNSPAIYTRVFTSLPWIESIVWNVE